MSIKICHITTAHTRNDCRIFEKECVSLANFGFDVTYLIADGFGNEIKKNVNIIDIGEYSANRMMRFANKTRKLYFHARLINAHIYHFHDPDFIPFALKLVRLKKAVIYDVHEDVPRQILQKLYIPKILRPTFSKMYELYENNSSKNLVLS